MKISLRNGIRVFFLVLIFVLWFTGNIQMWGPLLGLGLLAIPFGGRIFCGWVCPISTTIDLLQPIMKSPPLKYNKSALPKRGLQIFFTIVSIALLVFFNNKQLAIPFFILLIPVGVVVSYLFGESFWHHSCFIGIIYSWFGKWAKRGYFFQEEKCLGCQACVKVCPNSCIDMDAPKKPEIEKKNCLVCGKCKTACAPGVIQYGVLKDGENAEKNDKSEKTVCHPEL